MLLSHDNTKLGMIPSFAISTKSCTKWRKMQGCEKYCYAKTIERLRPIVRNKWLKNFQATKRKNFVEKMCKEIKWVGDVIRIHVAGDFYSQEYFNKWVEIARRYPYKTFYAYTKAMDIEFSSRPRNLPILLSDDKGIWEEMYDQFDGSTSFIKKKEWNQFKCKKSCDECLYCAGSERNKRNKRILFIKR